MSNFSKVIYMTVALLVFLCDALASPVNVTIDDQYGDAVTGAVPEYLPAASDWSQGATCSSCLVQPWPPSAYNGTWHDSTWAPGGSEGSGYSVKITFDGEYICVMSD